MAASGGARGENISAASARRIGIIGLKPLAAAHHRLARHLLMRHRVKLARRKWRRSANASAQAAWRLGA